MRSVRTGTMIVALAAGLMGGCGGTKTKNKDEGGGTPPAAPGGPGETKPPAPKPDGTPPPAVPAAACEARWQALVAAQAPGLERTYETTSDAGGQQLKMATRQTVLAASPAEVRTSTATTLLEPAGGTERTAVASLTKADFLATCTKPAAVDAPTGDQYHTEILAQDEQPVTVRAGTFACHHLKVRTTGTAGGTTYEGVTEVWTLADDSGILVRSVTHSSHASQAAQSATDVSTELVALKRP